MELQPLVFRENINKQKWMIFMKKMICLLSSLVGLAAFGNAQADNFYAGAFGGINWLQNNHHHQHARTGYLVGADIGYKWCNGLRTEFEFAYRNNRKHNSGSRHHTQNYAGLINVLYDFDTMGCWCLKPFLGAGIGVSSERKHHNGTSGGEITPYSSSSDNRKSSFAWQLIAGLAMPLNDCIDLSLQYRFFKTTHVRANNHGLVVGANYNF